jgi:hypothetical protein
MTDQQVEPLTAAQERQWRADIESDRWGSRPRWSSQSVASLFATLNAARSEPSVEAQRSIRVIDTALGQAAMLRTETAHINVKDLREARAILAHLGDR